MRRRRHRSCDRDVRQRGEVVQGQPLVVEPLDQLAVLQPRAEGDRLRAVVHEHAGGERLLGVQRLERDQVRGVGDAVERVPRAEHVHAGRAGDDVPQLVEARRPVQPRRPVAVVARPVGSRRPRLGLDHLHPAPSAADAPAASGSSADRAPDASPGARRHGPGEEIGDPKVDRFRRESLPLSLCYAALTLGFACHYVSRPAAPECRRSQAVRLERGMPSCPHSTSTPGRR